jgi:hypothetical protein
MLTYIIKRKFDCDVDLFYYTNALCVKERYEVIKKKNRKIEKERDMA